MKLKTSITFMVAIVLALVTAKVGMDYLKTHSGRGGAGARVVVATRDMEPGYVIQASDITLKEVPASMISAKSMRDLKEVTGRTVISSIASSYPLTEGVLAPVGAGAGMQAMIPAGMRLVTVDVSESSGVAGLITPGCKVDVIATLRDGDQSLATTIVQNVKVQFVQRGATRSSSGRTGTSVDSGPVKTVSLLVTPQQAVRVELANSEGKPRLILRGNSEETSDGNEQVNRNGLLGRPDPEPKAEAPPAPPPADVFDPPAEPKKGYTVEIIRGGVKSTETYDQEGTKEEGNSGASPAVAGKGKKVAGEAKRTESGTAPDKAPSTDAGRGNLR